MWLEVEPPLVTELLLGSSRLLLELLELLSFLASLAFFSLISRIITVRCPSMEVLFFISKQDSSGDF